MSVDGIGLAVEQLAVQKVNTMLKESGSKARESFCPDFAIWHGKSDLAVLGSLDFNKKTRIGQTGLF